VRGLLLATLCCGCATSGVLSGGDSRLDDSTKDDAEIKKAEKAGKCGPDEKGDVVLLDGRTGGPLTCALVTVSMAPDSCPQEVECASEVLFQGRTNRRGQFAVARPFSHVRLEVVSEGYARGSLGGASLLSGKMLEVEMPPDEGFWLKLLDGDGNYLQDVLVTFKAGDEVLATLRSNVLANVFFAQRNPFSGAEITVEADGYKKTTLKEQSDLGDDGHTLTLKR
jgi:hypothetical protein